MSTVLRGHDTRRLGKQMEFAFPTDEWSLPYCERILKVMQLLYDIKSEEGYQLVNERWRGLDFRRTVDQSIWLFHYSEREWADTFGNPRPYTGEQDQLAWQSKMDEAERRIESFFENGEHTWLWPPGWDVAYAYRQLYGDRPPGTNTT